MTTIQSIQDHIDALSGAPILQNNTRSSNLFKVLVDGDFQTIIASILGSTTGGLTVMAIIDFLLGNHSWSLTTMAGIGICSLVAFFGLARHAGRTLPAQPYQWNFMVKSAERILELNPTYADVIKQLIELIDDKRASCTWTKKMLSLLNTLKREEEQLNNRKNALKRIEVLAKTHQPTQNTVEDLVEVEPIRPTSQQINL